MLSLHRLVWFLSDNDDAVPEIDHRDGDGLNDRLGNLRAATSSQNRQNARLRRDNKYGVKGVQLVKGAWHGHITAWGKQQHLGCFATKEEASAAVEDARTRLHGEFARRM